MGGRAQRSALMANVLSLRHMLREAGLDYYGDPSAIVCVKMGTEGLARLVSKAPTGTWTDSQSCRIPGGSKRRCEDPNAGDGQPLGAEYRRRRSDT